MDLNSLECELTEIRPNFIITNGFLVSEGLQGIFAGETSVFHHVIVILLLLPKKFLLANTKNYNVAPSLLLICYF